QPRPPPNRGRRAKLDGNRVRKAAPERAHVRDADRGLQRRRAYGIYRTTEAGRSWHFLHVHGPAACSDSQLRLSVRTQGTATQTAIFLLASNRGREPCVLTGTAGFEIVQRDHKARINGNPFSRRLETTLAPGRTVTPDVWWANWCGSRRELSVVVRLRRRAIRAPFRVLPACISRGERSTLSRPSS